MAKIRTSLEQGTFSKLRDTVIGVYGKDEEIPEESGG
jgi:hypothetical protein